MDHMIGIFINLSFIQHQITEDSSARWILL